MTPGKIVRLGMPANAMHITCSRPDGNLPGDMNASSPRPVARRRNLRRLTGACAR